MPLQTCVQSFVLSFVFVLANCVAQESTETSNASAAGNDDVRKVMETYKGRGALADGSLPTQASKAVSQFKVADGLKIELVAEEPTVMQPLSINFDERGRMWVVQYRQYPFPAGLKVIRYDQYLRAVFDRVPAPPPNHIHGLDRITVFEDQDGDGVYDKNRDVIQDLNIATSVISGNGGIWVLNPPYLLRYPDADGDAMPDGDPVVHLSGFGLEDTHSVASSLTWGPDGWLYGSNGSTTTGNVRTRTGQSTAFQGQCIWRYHPRQELFEIYAEGGGNTFSLEIDSVGRVFSGTNNGDTRGMYYPQGSYGIKNWGKHGPLTNPYAFGFFQHMRFEGDGDRFAQTFAIYEGGTLPELYRKNIISANALHNRVWASQLLPDTSTFRTKDLPPVVETDDRWFRPVDVKVGPDGSVYLADWYDSRLSHTDPRDDWHKGSGRIYRLSSESSTKFSERLSQIIPTPTRFDLTRLTSTDLIELFNHPNKFFQLAAVRVLAERRDASVVDPLQKLIAVPDEPRALQALWTLHQAEMLDEETLVLCLQHTNEHVRRWAIRLIGDSRHASPSLAQSLLRLSANETSLQVRTQIACSAKRLPASIALPLIEPLLKYDADVSDLHQGLLLWWAIEAHCEKDRDTVLSILNDASLWDRPMVRSFVLEQLMQRFALAGKPEDLKVCSSLLRLAPSLEFRTILVTGLRKSLAGRASAKLPEELQSQLAAYRLEAKESDLPLRVRLGEAAAMAEAIKRVSDKTIDQVERIELVELLGQTRPPAGAAVLLKLTNDVSMHALQRVALQALSGYEDVSIAQTICRQLHSTLIAEDAVQRTAIGVLAGRPAWAGLLLDEIESARLKASVVPADIVQTMRLHDDESLQKRIQKIWGRTRETSVELQTQIERVRGLLREKQGIPKAGHELFKLKCGVCHTLFNEGGQTGPILTGYERDNLNFLLPAVIDPSSAVREEFTNFQILTHDGRVLTGLIDTQDTQSVTLRGVDNKTTRVSRDDIDILKASEISLMPEGLLRDLSDDQIRDLFAFITVRTYFDASGSK
ncbi:MAG: PVC-type heme-binding CxxCH protein [Pirellulaceae bacterium]|nr:PVC-type heme-binding CxxCH protein [Pirellulaceae bacterium]